MDGRRTVNGRLKHRWLRRTLWSIAIVILSVLILWKVPLFRHNPLCHARPAEGQELAPGVVRSFWFGDAYAIEEGLANHYIELFTNMLALWGVPFVEIDGIVLLRLWDRIADPTGYVFNADQKTMSYLFDPANGHPVWMEMPYDVRQRLLRMRQEAIEPAFCEYTRIMVLRNWGRD